MDSKDFNRIGVGVDDLIEAYMQVRLLPAFVGSEEYFGISYLAMLKSTFSGSVVASIPFPSPFYQADICRRYGSQTVLSVTAIDNLASKLINSKVCSQFKKFHPHDLNMSLHSGNEGFYRTSQLHNFDVFY